MPLISREPVLTPLSWSIDKKNFSSEYNSATVTYISIMFLQYLKTESEVNLFFFFFFSCIQDDEHQTGSQDQAHLQVGRDLLWSLGKPAAQSRINTGCKAGRLRFCPFRSWTPPRWRLHYILTVISFFHLHPVGVSLFSLWFLSPVLPPCTKHGTVTRLRSIEYSAEA